MAHIIHLVNTSGGDLDSDGSQPKKMYCMLYGDRLTERQYLFQKSKFAYIFFQKQYQDKK